eukprot:8096701-Karenia_brevis.AAC.1
MCRDCLYAAGARSPLPSPAICGFSASGGASTDAGEKGGLGLPTRESVGVVQFMSTALSWSSEACRCDRSWYGVVMGRATLFPHPGRSK